MLSELRYGPKTKTENMRKRKRKKTKLKDSTAIKLTEGIPLVGFVVSAGHGMKSVASGTNSKMNSQ